MLCYYINNSHWLTANIIKEKIMKKAFTLAETLITIGIIGVIAAITIPLLIQKYQEKVTVVMLKKHYSMMQQAYQTAINEKGSPGDWGLKSSDNIEENILYHLKPYIKIIKDCENKKGCWGIKYSLNGNRYEDIDKYSNYYKAILADGSIIAVRVNDSEFSDDVHRWAEYMIDLNGDKGPNVLGKDVFNFMFTKTKVKPYGQDSYGFDDGWCSSISPNKPSVGCAAWVLQNENMDYLHCNDLSLNSKTSCK